MRAMKMKSLYLSAVLAMSALSALPVWAGPQVPVKVMAAQAVNAGYEIEGVVEPVKHSTVSAQASGRVLQLLVKVGERVRAGQVLATIDDRDTQTLVQRSGAQLAQADAELANAQANFKRTQELQAKGFVSQAALEMAQTQFKAAQAGRAGAGAGAQQAQLAQSYTKVTAPFEGYVFETHAQAGDLAVPGAPMVTVYAPQPLRVVVQVPASQAQGATSAQQVLLRVPDGQSGQWVKPAVHHAVGAADPVSQTMTWKLDVPADAAAHMIPGQSLRVRFVSGATQRMVVPAAAVLRRGEVTGVYVATADGFALKAVRLGADHGKDGVEVLAGLKPGDAVAVDAVKAGLAGAQATKN